MGEPLDHRPAGWIRQSRGAADDHSRDQNQDTERRRDQWQPVMPVLIAVIGQIHKRDAGDGGNGAIQPRVRRGTACLGLYSLVPHDLAVALIVQFFHFEGGFEHPPHFVYPLVDSRPIKAEVGLYFGYYAKQHRCCTRDMHKKKSRVMRFEIISLFVQEGIGDKVQCDRRDSFGTAVCHSRILSPWSIHKTPQKILMR